MITREQVKEARTSLKEMYLQHYKDVFGIDIGTVVVCRDKSSKRNGYEYCVTRIEVDMSCLPNYPRFYAAPKNKEGEWSKLEISFLSGNHWELKV